MSTEEHKPDDLDAALRAAFGAESSPAQPSILRILQQRTGTRLDLELPDVDGDGGAPVRIDDEAKALRDPTGRYQLLGELARGGVGVVYKGRDQDLGRDVAMKVLRAEYANHPDILERFVEEAQIGGQLQHPGIVPVYELGLQRGERPYFAMKLVKGETLAVHLGRRASPDEDRHRFLGVFEQICQTIGYAHARHVVHRDLKPANVMLGSFGEVQVVDWGFAKVLQKGEVKRPDPARKGATWSVISTTRSDPKRGSQSVAGSMMGTPAYMPPEQALGDVESLDERSDVFGLGAILCEILTGGPPYLESEGDLIAQATRANMQGVHARLDRSGADATMIALCKQCLAPSRLARPASGKEVADAVAQYLSSIEERAHAAQIRAAEARVRARATIALAAAAVLVLLLGGGAYVFVTGAARERRERAAGQLATSFTEANLRLGEARAVGAAGLPAWERAQDAAQRAEALAKDPDVAEDARAAANALRVTVDAERERARAEAARAAKDDALRARLAELRTTLAEYAMQAQMNAPPEEAHAAIARRYEELYSKAFEDYLGGRKLDSMTTQAAAAELAGPLSVDIAAALDDWSTWPSQHEPGQPERAELDLSRLRALAMTLDPDPWRNRLRALRAGKTPNLAAVQALREEGELRELPPISLVLLARAFSGAGAPRSALEVLEIASGRHPSDFDLTFDLGTVLLGLGELPRAEGAFRAARALRPTSSFASTNLGVTLREQGRIEQAAACYRTAIVLDPENAPARMNLGLVMADLGKREEALGLYREALALDPQYWLAFNNTGLLLLDLARVDEAVEAFQKALAIAPNVAMVHHNLGDAYAQTRQHELAIPCYERALALAPRDVDTHNNLALTLQQSGDDAGAIESFGAALAIDPENAPAHYNLGNLLVGLGERNEGIEHLRRAVASWGKGADAYSRHWHERAKEKLRAAEQER
ncbi:MAG: tetratricopeptide repeat protein [Planctomycetes bacterium]|nr:tetratricopeptide repeat protein [Planctomycetota bacterium]